MKILLVSQWYAPEPIAPVPELAEGLAALGHEVQVLTGFPNWPSGKIYPGYAQRLWRREILNGIPIVRIPLYPNHTRSPLRRAWNFVSFSISVACLAPFLIRRPDVVYGVHPPITTCISAALLSILWRRPFVMEIMDMWPETLKATGMIRVPWMLSFIGWTCKKVYGHASAIRVVSEGFRQNLIHKGVSANKINVISNWVDTNFYRPTSPDRHLLPSFAPEGFMIMYAGAIGLAQGLQVILESAELLKDMNHVRFVLVGDGIDCELLKQQCKDRQINSIHFVGRVPISRMPSILSLADSLLVHLRPDPLFSITVPHKIYAYLASGKPILGAVSGEAASIIKTSNAGLICQPGNAIALATLIRTMVSMPKDSLLEMGANGRVAACACFERSLLINRVATMVEQSAYQAQ